MSIATADDGSGGASDGALRLGPACDVSLVIPLLNGIGHLDVLRARFPSALPERSALSRPPRRRPAPSSTLSARAPVIEIGVDDPGVSDRARAAAESLRSAGIGVEMNDSEATVRWTKLVRIGPVAALCAVTSSASHDITTYMVTVSCRPAVSFT